MSIPFRLADVLCWTGGRVHGDAADIELSGVSIDTRSVAVGDLFVAIRGERHDAHRFLAQAVEAGAAGLLLADAWLAENEAPGKLPVVAVDDTTIALGALARGHRAGFSGPLIAITGSNGKTTTKELCHAILSVGGPSLKNAGNLNNEFGLPLTLLSRRPEHSTAVVELGMNHRGEIARLAAIARPDIGVITNVGTAHIEFLGSRDEIALEKGDLVAALAPDGVAVLNRDDERAFAQAGRVACRVLSFGRDPGADVRALAVRFVDGGAFAFRLATTQGECDVRVRGLAETTVINALAAAAAALAAGSSLGAVAEGLASFDQVPGRMAYRRLPGGAQLIDDSYNANPQSMRNAIESLAKLKGEGRSIAVLGEMGELGAAAAEAHHETGRLVADEGTDFLFVLGERAQGFAEGALAAGMDPGRIRIGEDHAELAGRIRSLLRSQDWVLVKGSRAARMERVVEVLVGEEKD